MSKNADSAARKKDDDLPNDDESMDAYSKASIKQEKRKKKKDVENGEVDDESA